MVTGSFAWRDLARLGAAQSQRDLVRPWRQSRSSATKSSQHTGRLVRLRAHRKWPRPKVGHAVGLPRRDGSEPYDKRVQKHQLVGVSGRARSMAVLGGRLAFAVFAHGRVCGRQNKGRPAVRLEEEDDGQGRSKRRAYPDRLVGQCR